MAATITKLDTRGRGSATAATAGGAAGRAALQPPVPTPAGQAQPKTARPYTRVPAPTARGNRAAPAPTWGDRDRPSKQARIPAKGGDTMWITWGSDTAHLLPRLIAGRERGPLFLSQYRPGPYRKATTDPRDICPGTGRARLGYDRAPVLLAHYGDGPRLHQLRHSSATHLGQANVSASVLTA